MPPARPGILSWILLATLGLIWGGAFPGVTIALESFGPLTVAALRISIAAVVLTVIAAIWSEGLPSAYTASGRQVWKFSIGMGVFSNALPFSLLSWGQQYVSAGFAGICMTLVPLLILSFAHFFVPGERFGIRKLLGFMAGFAGVMILIRPSGLTQFEGYVFLAQMACVLSTFCYSTGAIITRLKPPSAYLSFAAAGLVVASVVVIPLALIVEGWPDGVDARAVWAVLYLALLPTALATILLVYVIQTAGPGFFSLVNYQVPVWAIVFGVVFLNEDVPPAFLIGLMFIFAGLAISQTHKR